MIKRKKKEETKRDKLEARERGRERRKRIFLHFIIRIVVIFTISFASLFSLFRPL